MCDSGGQSEWPHEKGVFPGTEEQSENHTRRSHIVNHKQNPRRLPLSAAPRVVIRQIWIPTQLIKYHYLATPFASFLRTL